MISLLKKIYVLLFRVIIITKKLKKSEFLFRRKRSAKKITNSLYEYATSRAGERISFQQVSLSTAKDRDRSFIGSYRKTGNYYN